MKLTKGIIETSVNLLVAKYGTDAEQYNEVKAARAYITEGSKYSNHDFDVQQGLTRLFSELSAEGAA